MASAPALPPPLADVVQRQAVEHAIAKLARFLSHPDSDHNLPAVCLALARVVDVGITFSITPSNSHDLFVVLKKVWHRRKEANLLSAIMVLMISLKNACRYRWFQAEDSTELLAMANEICSSFDIVDNVILEGRDSSQIISKVVHRYCPSLTCNYLITSFEIKEGYKILVSAFDFMKDLTLTESIRLFVTHKDNLETSSCLVTPSQVNFLINGKYVEGRTNTLTDYGPQLPTDITRLVKKGINLFQAIGSFCGNYVIAIAVMSSVSTSDIPPLQNYVHPVTPADEQDSEIIEDASGISLNCPISFQRLKVPVKGHLCKHHQCFDYDNFLKINSRKPTWRCPLCNQHVSYVDIRLDQDMIKILREVGENVTDVLILKDGSWRLKDLHESNHNDHEARQYNDKDASSDSVAVQSDFGNNILVVDLTTEDDHEIHVKDGKPFIHVDQPWLLDYIGSNTTPAAAQDLLVSSTLLNTAQHHSYPATLSTLSQPGPSGHGMHQDNFSVQNAPAVGPSGDGTQLQQINLDNLMELSSLPSVSTRLGNTPCMPYIQRPPMSGLGVNFGMSNSLFQLPSFQDTTNGGLTESQQEGRSANITYAPRQLHQGTQQQLLSRQVTPQYSSHLWNPLNAAMPPDDSPHRGIPYPDIQNSHTRPLRASQTMSQTSHPVSSAQFCNMARSGPIGIENMTQANHQPPVAAQHASTSSALLRRPAASQTLTNITRSSGSALTLNFEHNQVSRFDGLVGNQVARFDGLPGSTDWHCQTLGNMRGRLTGNDYSQALRRYLAQPNERSRGNPT